MLLLRFVVSYQIPIALHNLLLNVTAYVAVRLTQEMEHATPTLREPSQFMAKFFHPQLTAWVLSVRFQSCVCRRAVCVYVCVRV